MEENVIEKKLDNPGDSASLLSNIFYYWTYKIFLSSYRSNLTEEDIFKTKKSHVSHLLANKLQNLWNTEVKLKRNSLTRATWTLCKNEIIAFSLMFYVFVSGTKIIQPLLLLKILNYYINTSSKNESFFYVIALILSLFVQLLSNHCYVIRMQEVGIKARVAISSLIYRKSLKLSQASINKISTGHILTLLSKDSRVFQSVVMDLCYFITAPSDLIVFSIMLYYLFGYTALVGILFMVIFLPIQMYNGKLSGSYRLKVARKTDQRISLMSEIINGIKVIKMYTWEKPFAKLVATARSLEIREIRIVAIINSFLNSYGVYTSRTAQFLSILAYTLNGNAPVAQYVFIVTLIYNHLSRSLSLKLLEAVTDTSEFRVSSQRIQNFLLLEEIQINNSHIDKSHSLQNIRVDLHQISSTWNTEDLTLNNVNFQANPKEKVAIIGPIGSGKSSLLNVIIGEMPIKSGEINVSGSTSYVAQEPWLFKGSIRQNILFGQPMELKKYQNVVKVCALEKDFDLLPFGDSSIVGEKGVMLSGGQKARISLARGIYKDADIYLLDDPLSAVDSLVGKQLFERCICGYLADKCVILVTHQLRYISAMDVIYLLSNGSVAFKGTYKELVNNQANLAGEFYLSEASEEEEITENKDNDFVEKDPTENKETITTGSVKSNIYSKYFTAGGSCIFYITIFFLIFFNQICASFADYFVTFWVNLEQLKYSKNISNVTYFGQSYFELQNMFNTHICILVYFVLTFLLIVVTLASFISFYQYCLSCSNNLHNNMFDAISKAPMRFFNTNPSGRIINRFSQDIIAIDEVLPDNLLDTLGIATVVVGVSMILSSLNPWMLIPTLLLLLLFYIYSHVFLNTTRNIKRIEGTLRSPIYSHMTASLQGLSTIRALNAQSILIEEFDRHQDNHSAAYYLYISCNRAFGIFLDMHCILYVSLVTISTFLTSTFGGNLGLAITQSMGLTGNIQRGIRQWSETENQMISVERVLEYSKIEAESNNILKPPRDWPENGKIEFDSVSLRYGKNEPKILKDISFEIKPKQKIGIVGRTGAGKSSIISALFNLESTDGVILIDGMDIKSISLESLRSKLSIIPQEPFLFSGTLRKNLDPFDEYDNEILWEALEKVELKHVIENTPNGLNSLVNESGSNFSVGQKQLLCLARALMRKNKILIIDEATANVDSLTDSLIQATIREKFSQCTVLTIAHRLNTVMDADKILVIDNGKIVEFDHPYILLSKNQGLFYDLVMESNKELINLAKENFEKGVK